MATIAQPTANSKTIADLYGDQAGARTAQIAATDTSAWCAALNQAVAKAHTQRPDLAARIDAAQTLVLEGAVALGLEGHATVRSCSDAGVFYEVNGVCSCKDAQHGAPDGLCKHRLAVGLVKRATKHTGSGPVQALAAPVVVPTRILMDGVHPEDDVDVRRCQVCWLALEDGEVDCDCARIPAAQSPLPQAVAPAPCPEAAFSLCLKGRIDGQDAQLTVRGQTQAEFLANVAAVRGMFDAPVQASAPSSPE